MGRGQFDVFFDKMNMRLDSLEQSVLICLGFIGVTDNNGDRVHCSLFAQLTLDEPDREARIRASLPANPVMDTVPACSVADQQALGCFSCSNSRARYYPISWTHRNVEVHGYRYEKKSFKLLLLLSCRRRLTAPATYRALRSLSFIKPAKIAWKWLIVRGAWCLARPCRGKVEI